MYVKLLMASIILGFIVLLVLGVKLLFNPKAEPDRHTCAFKFQEGLDENNACSKCQLKDLGECKENKSEPDNSK